MSSPALADFARQLRGVHVADREIGHDQIELRIGVRQFERLGATGDMRDPGNLLQVQFERFVDQQFVEAAVFAQDERVVETGDQQDVLHAERHQVLEAFKALFGIENRLGDGRNDHGEDRVQLIILAGGTEDPRLRRLVALASVWHL